MLNDKSKKSFFRKMVVSPFLLLIRLYQFTISPDHGLLRVFYPDGYCKYWPSCSEYGAQALERHGLITGSYLAARRVLRCNPWSGGGIDEVPR